MKDGDGPHAGNCTSELEFAEADSESELSRHDRTDGIDIDCSQWNMNGTLSKCNKNATPNMLTNSKLNISGVQRNLNGTTTSRISLTATDSTNKRASLPHSPGDQLNSNNIKFIISKQTDNSFIIKNADSLSNKISSVVSSPPGHLSSGSNEKRIEAYDMDRKKYCFKVNQTLPVTKSYSSDSSNSTLVKNTDITKAETKKIIPYATKNFTITKVPEEQKFSLDPLKPTIFVPSDNTISKNLGPYTIISPLNHKTPSKHLNVRHPFKTSNNDSMKTKETQKAKEIRTRLTETNSEPREHHFRNDFVDPVTPIKKMNGNLSVLKPDISVKKDHHILEDSNILYTNTNLIPDFIISSIQGGIEHGDENINKGSHREVKELDSIINDNEKSSVCDQIAELDKNQPKLNNIKTQGNEHYKNTNLHLDEDKNSSKEHYQSTFRVKRSDIAKNSSFVIDKKHEVLATDSNLKYVQDVPKLSAQEAYTKKVSKITPFNTNGVDKINQNADSSIKEILMVKPKTVAEKRRLLELARKKEFKIPETIAPKIKCVPVVKDKTVKKKVKRNHRIVKKPVQRRSYVLYKDRKIWVNTGMSKKCLANINSRKKDESVLQRKKLFLLNPVYKSSRKLLYRPGPLSKKQFLQISETHLWKTQMVKLPKITLEVFPQLGRLFCNTALHRLNNVIGGELDGDKIEFALSALLSKSKDENENIIPEPIRFPLTYEKKLEYTLIRKKKPQPETVNSKLKTSVNVNTESVASVIEDLIKYVEIKEIASSLIKEDDIEIHNTSDADLELPTKNNSFEAPVRKRLSKVERELLRLNHKVVKVDDKDGNDCITAICDKPYCKLGCVCSSLSYNFSSDHCQELGCMFNCTCPKETSSMYDDLSFHSGTKVLSKNTLIRIEDEAKKNLAKVEREFTQTVIHTNDRTVLVGVGDRTKTRRTAKTPAKFSDFISSEEIESITKECFITLQELDLSDIIPFCLTHYEYSCRCKGFTIPKLDSEVNENSVLERDSSIRNKPVKAKYKRVLQDTDNVCNDDFRYTATKLPEDKPEMQVSKDKKLPVPDNKLLKHNVLKGKYIPKQNSSNLPQKRKRSIDTSEDSSISSPMTFDDDACVQAPKNPRTEYAKPVFDGEIIIDSSNTELLKSLGGQEFARLIPWKSLINGFRNSSINIWYSTKRPSTLLINKSGTPCPENCFNIRTLTSNRTPIISWIKNNKLPAFYKEDSFSFLLKENKGSYEICGVSTKNMPSKKIDKEESAKQERFYHRDIQGVKKSSLITKTKYHQIYLIPENLTENFRISAMCVALPETFCGCKWQTVFLNSDFAFLSFNTIPFSIRYTDLLIITKYAKEHKCTIYLRNDEMPKEYNHKLFGIYCVENFTDRIFIGPYLVHDIGNDVETLRYVNKFLVPSESVNLMFGKEGFKSSYWLKEERKRKTAPEASRPSNICFESKQSLVNTDGGESSMNVETTIDLTLDDDDTVSKSDVVQKSVMVSSNSSQVMHDNVEMEIINSSPKNPEDYDSYIVTNIPGFGYLGAFQHVNGQIDISWPLEDKLLRFNHESSAISFLQRRFSSLLIRVPESFQIVFSLTSELDLKAYKPIDSSLLSGQFICGKFGCVHISKLDRDPHFIQSGIDKEVVVQLILKRNRKLVKQMYESLASTLDIKKEENGYNEQNILNKALQEIQLLKNKEKQIITVKNSLYLQKRELFIMMYKLLSKLPPEQRNVENRIFRSILDKSETSPIEIIDSDDELQISKTDEVLTTESTIDQILPVSNPMVPITIKQESTMQPLVQFDTFSQRTESESIDAVPVGSSIRNSNGELRIRTDILDTYDPVASVIVDLDDIPSDTDL